MLEVYRNLHKECFSVREHGRVIDHVKYKLLAKCEFAVSEAGRQRVLRERHKNVHAVIRGLAADGSVLPPLGRLIEVSYNPYVYEKFFRVHTKEFIESADFVLLVFPKVFLIEAV